MSDETKKECNHEWIGDTCCQCGIRWQVYADDAIKERDQLRAQLDLSAEPDPNGTMAARLNWWKVESDELNEKWAETRRQLDAVTKERDELKRAIYRISRRPYYRMLEDSIRAAIAAEKGTK